LSFIKIYSHRSYVRIWENFLQSWFGYLLLCPVTTESIYFKFAFKRSLGIAILKMKESKTFCKYGLWNLTFYEFKFTSVEFACDSKWMSLVRLFSVTWHKEDCRNLMLPCQGTPEYNNQCCIHGIFCGKLCSCKSTLSLTPKKIREIKFIANLTLKVIS
jgi:hypothetical protein